MINNKVKRQSICKTDAVICGLGLFASMQFFYFTSILALGPLYVIYIFSFLALWSINLNWALVGDVLLVRILLQLLLNGKQFCNCLNCVLWFKYVVIPSRRATATALQVLAGHLLGYASSPYIIGAVGYYFMFHFNFLFF